MKTPLKRLIPAGHIYIRDSILEKANIVGISIDRAAWAKDLDLPMKADYTFFAGCGYQFMKYAEGMAGTVRTMEKAGIGMAKMVNVSETFSKVGVDLTSITARVTAAGRKDPYTGVLVSAVNVLRKLGVDIGYLGEDEPCCGSPNYYAGFVDEFRENAQRTHGAFKSHGTKKIIGIIPACTATMRVIYQQYVEGYDLEVMHFFEIVARRLKETSIKPKLKEKLVITYHDPCQLSRYLRITDEPREIMKHIEGLEVREPESEKSGQWSTCCGGGGLEVSNPELSDRIGIRRVTELLETGANIIATNCPACMMQLKKSAKKLKADIEVRDVAEILNEALG
jgi:Fe-S oxidoreductase